MRSDSRLCWVLGVLLIFIGLHSPTKADVEDTFSKNVNGGGNYTEIFTKEGASTYTIEATVSNGWQFIDPTGLSAPSGWTLVSSSSSRRALYNNVDGNSLADIFSARIYGKVTKPGEGQAAGKPPSWSLEGTAKKGYRIVPKIILMWIEDTQSFESLEGDNAVSSY